MPTVKGYGLGKLPPRIDKRTISFMNILKLENLPPLPPSYDVDIQLGFQGFSDSQMYLNDTLGDCVIAGRAHMMLRQEGWEQKLNLPIIDAEVKLEYFKETGGSDSGLVMLDSLNAWRQGWIAASQPYNIYAYASLNIASIAQLQYSIYLLYGAYTGIQIPYSAIDQFNAGKPWDALTFDGGIAGGHCVYICAYDSTYMTCMTWGKRQQMTYAFWNKYSDEAYGVIDDKDKWGTPKSPFDTQLLDSYLNEITQQPGPPNPSPCKRGNAVAKVDQKFHNFLPWAFHRTGRFYISYMNPPKKRKKYG
jgi:hypothetical protein